MGSSPSHMEVSGCRFPRGFTGWAESQTGAWPESTRAWPDKSISKIEIKETNNKNKNIKDKFRKEVQLRSLVTKRSAVKKCS